MSTHSAIRRITFNALMLALLCLVGMFSIPLGDNIKVSLQLLMVFIICLTARSFVDALIVTGCYLLIGLFAPVYAGFASGVSPTFGYVISFVAISPIIYFMNKIPKLPTVVRMGLACLTGLLVCYVIGTAFMMLYLGLAKDVHWDLGKTLLVSVVPYIPFDLAKIVLAVSIVKLIPASLLEAKR